MKHEVSRRAAAAVTCLVAGLTTLAADNGGFSKERALSHVRLLSGTLGSRYNGTPGESEARNYIAHELSRSGIEVSREQIARRGEVFIASENVVGVLRGRADRIILISAHHDTANPYTPGASDDASGIAVMLEAARLLSTSPPLATVVFVSFCAEHSGLAGSRTHLARRADQELLVVLNLQDLGRGPVSFLSTGSGPPLWAARALSWSLRGGDLEGVFLDPLSVLAARGGGDGSTASHVPFERQGVPSLTIAGRIDPSIRETPLDSVSRIDPDTLEAAGRLLTTLVRRFDELPPSPSVASRYVPLPVGDTLYIIAAPAIVVLAALVAVLGVIWWRVFWWRARRRGRRMTSLDAFRVMARAGIPVVAAASMVLLGEESLEGFSAVGPVGSIGGTFRLLLTMAFFSGGLGLGWLIVRPLSVASEVEIHTTLAYLLWGGYALTALAAGHADLAFYFLVPAALTLAVSLLSPRWAGVGALAGFAPTAGLLRSPTLVPSVDRAEAGVWSWHWMLLLLPALVPLAVAMARTFSLPGRRVSLFVLGSSASVVLALIGTGLGGGSGPAATGRRIHIEETVPSGGPARVRLTCAEGLGSVGDLPGSAGEIDTHERVHEINLPEGGAGQLLDVLVETRQVESVHLTGVSGVKDVRVILLPTFLAERVEVTLRTSSKVKVLDGGSWSRGDRFTRILAYPAGPENPAVITFRVAGRAGQTIHLESRAVASRDVLGLAPRAQKAWFTWWAEVFRTDSARL